MGSMAASSLPTPPARQRFRRRLLTWYRANGRDLPWRRTSDPYHILVSEVMLQQTQVERVLPRYLRWLERWPTVSSLATADTADVLREWQGLGYNRRALNLQRAARVVAAARCNRAAARSPTPRTRRPRPAPPGWDTW